MPGDDRPPRTPRNGLEALHRLYYHRLDLPELDFEPVRDAPLPAGSRVERYEDADHYCQHVTAPTGFLSLYFGGNVSEAVVADLAHWVHDTPPR